jgi:hypothetical protein
MPFFKGQACLITWRTSGRLSDGKKLPAGWAIQQKAVSDQF